LICFDFLLFLIHFFVKVLVVVVSIEKFFEFFLIQQLHVLLDLVTIVILPLAISVIGIEIVFEGRDEWRIHSMIEEIFPLEVSQPRMVLDVFRTV